MTPDEIGQVYGELEQMFVPLEMSPERGLTYIRERLTMVRAMADRVAEIRLKVSRALSTVLEDHLVAQQIHEVQPTPDSKRRVKELEILKQRHTMLTKMVAMQAQVLSRTSLDIRLLADITKEQIKRGEINPNETPGMVKDVAAEALAGDLKRSSADVFGFTESRVEFRAGPTHVEVFPKELFEPAGPDSFGGSDYPLEPSPQTIAAVEDTLHRYSGVQTVGFDAPDPPPADDRMKLADTSATNIATLFNEEPHGTPGVF